MASDIAALRRERTTASTRMSELATAARGRSMTDDEQRDFDAAASQVTALDTQITAAEGEGDRTSAASVSRADASEIARLCVEGGVPAMASALLAGGVSVADAKVRIAATGEIKNLVALAHRKDSTIPLDLAATFLAEGKTVEQARDALFYALVANEEKQPTSSHVPTGGADGKTGGPAAKVDLVADMKRRHPTKD